MGKVLKVVVAVAVVLVASSMPIATLIGASVSDSFESFMSEQVGVVLGLFGIDDEDQVSVNVSDSLLFDQDDDTVANLLTQVALTHQKTDRGIIDILMESSNRARGSYTNYYNKGDTGAYSKGLPETNLRARTIPEEDILDIIDSIYVVSATALASSQGVPSKEEWTYFNLYEDYGYESSANEMVYTGVVYGVRDIEYNYIDDTYTVTLGRRSTVTTTTTVEVVELFEYVTTKVVTTTTITVSSIDESYDNVNTTVTEQTTITGTATGIISDTTIELSNIDEIVDVGTVVDSTSEVVEESVENINYVDQVTTTVEVDRDVVEGTIQESLTSTVEEVPIDSVEASVDVNTVTDNDYESTALVYNAPAATAHFVTKYTTDGTNVRYWIYEIGSGGYAALDDTNQYITSLEMLPIVSIRNNKTSLVEGSTEYKEAEEILSTIGVDVGTMIEGIEENDDIEYIESAHIYFGVDPTVEDPIIAKAVYETFDYVYQDSDLYDGESSSYLATIQEDKYNASLSWDSFGRSSVVGSIGSVGTYTNSVEVDVVTKVDSAGAEYTEDVDVLVLRKQISETTYVEYRISYLVSTTFIKNGGFANVTAATLTSDKTLTIPISKFFINQFSGLEQLDLFTKSLRMAVYAIQVTHLRYYQTESFAKFIKVVMYIIAIVIFVFTWYTGGASSASFVAAVQSVLAGYAVSRAFVYLLNKTDNKIAQALLTVVAVAVASYTGDVNGAANVAFLSVNMLTTAVNVHIEQGYSNLEDDMEKFQTDYEERQEELDEASEDASVGDIEFIATLQKLPSVNEYYYAKKGSIQYQYDALFDYDRVTGVTYYEQAFDIGKSSS